MTDAEAQLVIVHDGAMDLLLRVYDKGCLARSMHAL
jgi:hypothetical protein